MVSSTKTPFHHFYESSYIIFTIKMLKRRPTKCAARGPLYSPLCALLSVAQTL